MDPAADSGKGKDRGSKEGLTRNSCSLSPEQTEGLRTGTPFISSMAKSRFISPMAPSSILNTSQDRVKGNYESPPWPHRLYSSLGQVRTACWCREAGRLYQA